MELAEEFPKYFAYLLAIGFVLAVVYLFTKDYFPSLFGIVAIRRKGETSWSQMLIFAFVLILVIAIVAAVLAAFFPTVVPWMNGMMRRALDSISWV